LRASVCATQAWIEDGIASASALLEYEAIDKALKGNQLSVATEEISSASIPHLMIPFPFKQ
jgi:hypothetical protein